MSCQVAKEMLLTVSHVLARCAGTETHLVMGTTLRYPMLNPTKNPLQPLVAYIPLIESLQLRAPVLATPPTCIRRRMTSKGYDAV